MPVARDIKLAPGVQILQPDLVNLYRCEIEEDTRIGLFVEIQRNAVIGARCKISSHSFICEGVTIESEVFVGHGVILRTTCILARPMRTGRRRVTATGEW